MKCSFCGDKLKPGGGKMLVRRSGEILYFCSKKCEVNYFRGSKRRKWSKG